MYGLVRGYWQLFVLPVRTGEPFHGSLVETRVHLEGGVVNS